MTAPQRRFRGSPHDRDIVRLAVPAFGSLVAAPLYVLTDTAIIGHVGTDELAGLALASTVLLTVANVLVFLAYGTTGSVGRALGAGNTQRAATIGVQATWLAGVIGAALALVIAATATPAIGLFDAEESVREHAVTYLRISAIGLPAILIAMAGTGYLRGLQDTKTPLVVAVSTAVLNLVVELWFVFGLDAGVAGSAWSTVLAEWFAAGIYMVMILRAAQRERVDVAPRITQMRSAATGSVSLMARTLALRGAFVIAVVVAATKGTVALAAHEIATQIWVLLALSLDAIAIAGQALVARHLGAGDAEAARSASSRMIQLAIAFGVVVGVVLLTAASPIARIFTDDPEVVDLTAFLIVYVAAMQPIGGHVFALDGILIGAGDLGYLARAMWLSTIVFAAGAVAVWRLDAGIGWLWATLTIFMVVRAATLHARFRTDTWLTTGG